MLTAAAGLLLLTVGAVGAADVRSSTVRFGPEDKFTGHLVRPTGQGPFPALVVVHEWWGLNDSIRNEATRLAREGYVALAVDLFGKSTTDPEQARQRVQALDQKAATAQLLAAAGYLRSQPYVHPDRVGSIGWCFGGAQSLNLALNDPKLAAAVIYYGRPVTDPEQVRRIRAAVLGVFGEADESIPMSQVDEFRKALTTANVKHKVLTCPGAGHAVANPSGGERYKPDAARDAWRKKLEFLDAHLRR